MNRLEDYIFTIFGAIVSSISGGIVWIVRRVLTNQRQLALLEAEMATRVKMREEDRERMTRIEEQNTQILETLLKGQFHVK